ncbi:MAG: hypothetical protein ACERKJ_12195 [Candidatus Dadabacteria bacterium]
MDFTIKDRDMLKRHDEKLKTLCTSVATGNSGIETIITKLNANNVGCVENRKECMSNVNKTFVTGKTFWSVVGFMLTGVIIIISIIALVM